MSIPKNRDARKFRGSCNVWRNSFLFFFVYTQEEIRKTCFFFFLKIGESKRLSLAVYFLTRIYIQSASTYATERVINGTWRNLWPTYKRVNAWKPVAKRLTDKAKPTLWYIYQHNRTIDFYSVSTALYHLLRCLRSTECQRRSSHALRLATLRNV